MVDLARGAVLPATHVDRLRAVEDIAMLGSIGLTTVRLGLDWEWLQPSAGALDGDAAEFYLGLTQAARSVGVQLQFTLLERGVPKWFDNEGGFADAKWALHWWPRWVELCGETFGDRVGGWIPIDHPLAVANRVFPGDPRRHGEVLDTLCTAWRDAWRILRGGPPVVTAFGLEIVRPANESPEAAQAATRLDQIRFRLWFRALLDGIVTIPGRADREVADLAGAYDELGLLVRHERDTLGLLHRAAEMADVGVKPMSVTLLAPSGADADRELVIERYLSEATEAASGLPLRTALVSPTFDLAGDERGIISRDRDLKDSGRMFVGRTT
jgi:hypothetical protein